MKTKTIKASNSNPLWRSAQFRTKLVEMCNKQGKAWATGKAIIEAVKQEQPDIVPSMHESFRVLRSLADNKMVGIKREGRAFVYRGKGVRVRPEELYRRKSGTEVVAVKPSEPGIKEVPYVQQRQMSVDFIESEGKVQISVPGLTIRIGIVPR